MIFLNLAVWMHNETTPSSRCRAGPKRIIGQLIDVVAARGQSAHDLSGLLEGVSMGEFLAFAANSEHAGFTRFLMSRPALMRGAGLIWYRGNRECRHGWNERSFHRRQPAQHLVVCLGHLGRVDAPSRILKRRSSMMRESSSHGSSPPVARRSRAPRKVRPSRRRNGGPANTSITETTIL